MAQDGRHHTKCGLVGERNEEDDAGTVWGEEGGKSIEKMPGLVDGNQ